MCRLTWDGTQVMGCGGLGGGCLRISDSTKLVSDGSEILLELGAPTEASVIPSILNTPASKGDADNNHLL